MPETAAANSPAPRFSVIVPVYNVERYLPACVKSVVESPGPRDWECILIDDGSTDASGAMCDAFAAACPGVRALHQKNAGLAAARNAGLAAARGAWLLFLDSDDEWPAAMLQNLRRELDAHPGYDWYVGRYLERDEAALAVVHHRGGSVDVIGEGVVGGVVHLVGGGYICLDKGHNTAGHGDGQRQRGGNGDHSALAQCAAGLFLVLHGFSYLRQCVRGGVQRGKGFFK